MVDRFKKWGIKGGVSILDHAIYSGANFILTVLLARWLLPSHYGVYSVALAVYQFAFQAHNAVILEPMSVLGPAKMDDRLADYARDQIKLHFVATLLGGLIIAIAGAVILIFNKVLGQVLIILGVVLGLVLFPPIIRRVFYIFGQPQIAFIGSTIYALTTGVTLWVLINLIDMTVQFAFPIISFSGLISGFYLMRRMPPRQFVSMPVGNIFANNWQYGRWLLYSSFLIAFAAQAQTFVVGASLGLSDAGAFRALQNFIQPMILLFSAVSAFLLPLLSYDFGKRNIAGLRRKGRYLLSLFFILALSFELFLWLNASSLESLLYRGTFSSYTYLIPIWGLVPVAAAVTYVYYFLLQAIQRPKAILIGSVIWSATSGISAIILSSHWGLAGATMSVVLGYLFSGIAFAYFYRFYLSNLEVVRSI